MRLKFATWMMGFVPYDPHAIFRTTKADNWKLITENFNNRHGVVVPAALMGERLGRLVAFMAVRVCTTNINRVWP
jgi:hypothetical protein